MEEQFIVSARKYRPQTFKDVVGQQAITDTLLNAIETNHLAQALLFTGPRGVGKTTCARILARKINQPDYDDPTEDFSFNIFELDAASNNSVDDIRNLIDQVRIPPQTGKYKVYIIDEVHMLSQAAFNAFLKTLEEPPRHAIFILATTEKHKIIPTILSRCQIFDFKRITIQDAKKHLAEVAKSQGITAEDDALHIIAQKADGAMRDALSIFDRVVSFSGKHLTREAVTQNLNVLDYEYYIKATEFILENKIPDLLLLFNTILAKGFDAHHFVQGLASHFRDLLVCKNPETLQLLEVGETAKIQYQHQAVFATQEFLLEAIRIANDCDLKYKSSQNQRLLVELCLMQLASITFDGEKKKVDFIIPAFYFHSSEQTKSSENSIPQIEEVVEKLQIKPEVTQPDDAINALSISGLKKLKELKEANDKLQSERQSIFLEEPFTYDELITQWNKFKDRLEKKGYMIISSLMGMGEVILDGTTIKYEVPNESSKKDLEGELPNLLGYLRGHLKNHNIKIELSVNETIQVKKLLDKRDIFLHMAEKNPALELLRKTFDLNI